ncbi:MAG TPA: DUF1905 domain-containing protein [Acidimicrobiales bacterium]|nr:DUF1905 domain-containing protein [Acidimicrobiales bacterium]
MPLRFEFTGQVFSWRGPAPFTFVRVPEAECRSVREVASLVTYGWGMVPVAVRLGGTEWTTTLFPKDGAYLVPIKMKVQRAEQVDVGDVVTLRLDIDVET